MHALADNRFIRESLLSTSRVLVNVAKMVDGSWSMADEGNR
jgi:hypothetical protein